MNEILVDCIINNSDEKRASFNRKLITTKFKIYGVETSILEKKVKNIIRENISLKFVEPESYEEILIYGMYIAYSKFTNEKKLEMLKALLPYIDNWATCDMIACRLKNFEENEKFFKDLLNSKHTFYVRFAIVWLMRFKLKNDAENILNLVITKTCDEYYINMAIAWCVAETLVVNFEFAYSKIQTIKNDFVRKKSIQKACESFRISNDQKIKLKLLK